MAIIALDRVSKDVSEPGRNPPRRLVERGEVVSAITVRKAPGSVLSAG